jgi:hypothetical protein
VPAVHVSPGLHLFAGWHAHPNDPAGQSITSTEPEAPAGISHFADLQTPLAQSAPVEQVVFGSGTVGMQSPPVHVPLWQSLGWVHGEPAGEPEVAPPEPPLEVAPPEPPLEVAPPEPPLEVEPPVAVVSPPVSPLEPQAKAATPTTRNPRSPAYPRCC